jgi:hypothetical protein
VEPEGSLPHSQELSTCPCPEPGQSSPRHPILSPRSILIIFTHLHLVLSSGLFPTNNLYAFLFYLFHSKCPAHLIIDLIILIILGEEYIPRSSSLCTFLHPPVTSSFLDLNTLLSSKYDVCFGRCRTVLQNKFSCALLYSLHDKID